MMNSTTLRPESLLQKDFGVGQGTARVQRLPDETRSLAARYLSGEFGRAMKTAPFGLEGEAANRSPVDLYCWAVRRIVEEAPIRYEPLEYLAGTAPFLEAPRHQTPGSNDRVALRSFSHITIGFEKALRIGYAGIQREIEQRLQEDGLDDYGKRYLQAMLDVIASARIWHQRHIRALQEQDDTPDGTARKRRRDLLAILQRVPEHPPATFHEAVQALWEFWEIQRLCGNWSGIGRIDKMLGPFLEKDLREGRITLDVARDILAHFWIKGTEWTGSDGFGPKSTGDAQFYQNIILSGVDEQGRDVTNPVTYLVLDIVEELHISDFPVAVRVSDRTPGRLWRRIAEVQRLGGGIVTLYNEDLVIRALVQTGFPIEDARTFTNDGCWEVLIPGKSFFIYKTFDGLQLLKECLELDPARPVTGDIDSFERICEAFKKVLYRELKVVRGMALRPELKDNTPPSPLLDLWIEGCIRKGRPYSGGGPVYRIVAPHLGGFADVVNNLSAIRKFVFEEKRVSFNRLRDAVRNNWEGDEILRLQCFRDTPFYGNDQDEADELAQRVFNTYTGMCRELALLEPNVLIPPGISTFGREIKWRHQRPATFFGRKSGDILAANLSPTPGTDREGPTAVIKSYAKFDFVRLPNGSPLDLRLHPSSLKGETGLRSLEALLRTFTQLGGWYLQLDVVSPELLRDAQAHPEQYPNLVVRISGWSARFATLCKEWQDAIIERTTHGH
jgi:pyruvate-formate lyase